MIINLFIFKEYSTHQYTVVHDQMIHTREFTDTYYVLVKSMHWKREKKECHNYKTIILLAKKLFNFYTCILRLMKRKAWKIMKPVPVPTLYDFCSSITTGRMCCALKWGLWMAFLLGGYIWWRLTITKVRQLGIQLMKNLLALLGDGTMGGRMMLVFLSMYQIYAKFFFF